MIKKLRRKFIAAAMLSVFAVLVIILGSIVFFNYQSIVDGAEERISLIEANGGSFPMWHDMYGLFGYNDRGRLSAESPFDTRYFTVRYNASDEAVAVYTGSIAAVDDITAVRLADLVVKGEKRSGFCGYFRYRVSDYINGNLVIFVDSARELTSFRDFLSMSVFAGAVGLLLVFILVLVFSGIFTRPAAESYEKQKRFITDASHEIKTPLAIINSANEVLEMENGENDWTKSISNQVNRLSSLTQELIMLSRMEEDGFKLKKTVFNLSDVCLETAHSFDAVAQANEKTYNVSIAPEISYNGDKENISRLISLLLDNAMKYSDKNGTVGFSVTRSGKNIVIRTENTVEEIKKGNLNVLFERFYRSDLSRSAKTGGSGIGLSVAKAIVTSHGGKITAQSPDGKSVVFTVVL